MRALRRSILVASLVALAAVVGCLGLWVVGVWISDRFVWSQRLSFVPRQFFVWPAGIGWVAFAILSLAYAVLRPRGEGVPWRSQRRGQSRVPRLLGRARAFSGVMVLVATLHLLGVEWRWPMNAARAAPPAGARLRIIHWNVGWSYPPEVWESLAVREPDVAIVVNPLTRTDLTWDFRVPAEPMGDAARVIRDWPINVVSRWPIRRWGVTELGFTSPVSVLEEISSPDVTPPTDPGHAMFVELEVGPPFDRTLVIWIIDLPSDPGLWRPAVMRQARDRIGMWLGPNGGGFPEPDVMIGDFNTPARAWSLGALRHRPAYDMADAHAQAGAGPAGSFQLARPRDFVWLHIDQCFLGPGLRAARYSVEDGGDTRHWMQVVDIVAR